MPGTAMSNPVLQRDAKSGAEIRCRKGMPNLMRNLRRKKGCEIGSLKPDVETDALIRGERVPRENVCGGVMLCLPHTLYFRREFTRA